MVAFSRNYNEVNVEHKCLDNDSGFVHARNNLSLEYLLVEKIKLVGFELVVNRSPFQCVHSVRFYLTFFLQKLFCESVYALQCNMLHENYITVLKK